MCAIIDSALSYLFPLTLHKNNLIPFTCLPPKSPSFPSNCYSPFLTSRCRVSNRPHHETENCQPKTKIPTSQMPVTNERLFLIVPYKILTSLSFLRAPRREKYLFLIVFFFAKQLPLFASFLPLTASLPIALILKRITENY
jgi:hypothetical protein